MPAHQATEEMKRCIRMSLLRCDHPVLVGALLVDPQLDGIEVGRKGKGSLLSKGAEGRPSTAPLLTGRDRNLLPEAEHLSQLSDNSRGSLARLRPGAT